MSDAGTKPETSDTPTPANVLTLTKGRHRFQIRYAPGDESATLAHLTEMAQERPGGFDWFDAAVLSHQLGRHLSREVRAMAPKPPEKKAA